MGLLRERRLLIIRLHSLLLLDLRYVTIQDTVLLIGVLLMINLLTYSG